MLAVDLITRVGLATVLGVIIGIERQWRARMAGLQTMALVSMGSALFFILGAFSFPGGDPTRVAAQIVSGIGFLGAGVILKHGLSVVGLNTAATLWATAAVGALAGAWMWREAIAGAAIVVFGNLFLQPLARRMDVRSGRGTIVADQPGFVVEIVCRTSGAAEVRRDLAAGLADAGIPVRSSSSTRLSTSDEVVVRVDVTSAEGVEQQLDSLVGRFAADARVSSTRWAVSSFDARE